MARTPASSPHSDRFNLVERVTTPLGFLVFALLVVDTTVGGLIVSVQDYRGVFVWTLVISIFGFVLVVVSLAIFQSEALTGDPPIQSAAVRLADDLYSAIDGYLRNLEPEEQAEAWNSVAEILSNDPDGKKAYKRFCRAIANRLKFKAELGRRRSRGFGGPR